MTVHELRKILFVVPFVWRSSAKYSVYVDLQGFLEGGSASQQRQGVGECVGGCFMTGEDEYENVA